MLKNITQTTLLQAINVGLPFITVPWYVKKLGIGGYGKIGAALAIMQLLQLIVDYGFTLTAARSVAKSNDRQKTGSKLFADITISKLMVSIAGIAIISSIAYMAKLPFEQIKLILIGYIIVIGQALTPTWLYVGWQEPTKLLIVTIIPKILSVPIILLFINNEDDLILGMSLQVIPYLCTGIGSIWLAHQMGFIKLERPNLSRIKVEVKNAWPLFKSSAATSVTTSLTPLIINSAAGPQSLGIYLIADKIRQGVQSVLMPISLVVYPKISEELSNSKNLAFYRIKVISTYMLIGASIITLIFGIFSNETITEIFGNTASQASEPLRILMAATALTFCNTILGTYIMIPLGNEEEYSKMLIYSALLNMIILWPLVSNYSYNGASLAITFSELSLSLLLGSKLLRMNADSKKCEIKYSILASIIKSKSPFNRPEHLNNS